MPARLSFALLIVGTVSMSCKGGARTSVDLEGGEGNDEFVNSGSGEALAATELDPRDGAILVPRGYDLQITFDRPLDPGSVVEGCDEGATFVLGTTDVPCVAGTLTAMDHTLGFAPAEPLAEGVMHSVTVAGLRALDGSILASALVWSFTTGSDLEAAAPVPQTTPASGALIAPDSPLTLHFSSPIDEMTLVLSGLLADAAPLISWSDAQTLVLTPNPSWPESASSADLKSLNVSATGQYGVAVLPFTLSYLVDAAAPVLTASSPPGGGTLAGFADIVIHFDQSMDPGTLMFSDLLGGLAASVTGLAWSSMNAANDTLTLSTSTGWPNGAQELTLPSSLLDVAGRPLSSSVTLHFTIDAVAPAVTQPTPIPGATLFATEPLVLRFNDSMNPATLTLGALAGPLGAAASGIAWSTTSSPNDTLTVSTLGWPGGSGQALILPASLADAAGNALGSPVSFIYAVDALPPTIASEWPTDGAILHATMSLSFTFAEPMKPSSLTLGALGGSLAASVSGIMWSSADKVLTLTTAGWPDGPDQQLTLPATLKDAAGNPLGTSETYTFQVDAIGPTLQGESPANGSIISLFQTITFTFDEQMNTSSLMLNELTGSMASSASSISWPSNTTLEVSTSGGWPPDAGDITLPTTLADAAGNFLAAAVTRNYSVDVSAPSLTPNPLTDAALDWKRDIVITANENLSTFDIVVNGTLLVGATYSTNVSGNTLTLSLTGGTSWANDSNRTLSVTVEDVAGNAATVNLSYDVLDGAVYVRMPGDGGDETHPGTRSEPKATIAGAILQADAIFTNAEVRIAQGDYTETLTLPGGIELAGGYDPSDWELQPLRSRATQVIDPSSATTSANTITLTAPLSGLRKLIVRGSTAATTECAAVRVDVSPGDAPATIDDCEIQGGTCPTSYAINAVQGSLTLSGSNVRGGSGAYSYGLNVTGNTFSATGNRIFGGLGTSKTHGIYAATFWPVTLMGNVIHAGTPNTLGVAFAYGFYNYDNNPVLVANNWVSGGGNPSSTSHLTHALYLRSGTYRVLNNTLHSGNGYYSVCLENNLGAVQAENNICILKGYYTTSARTHVAFLRGNFAAGFSTLRNNDVFDFGDRSSAPNAFAFRKVASSGNCPGNSGYDCFPLGASPNYLDDEVVTTSGVDDGTADGNVFLDPVFVSLNGSDGSIDTMFDTFLNLENDWRLDASSPIKSLGLDGTAPANNYGFTSDRAGATRTGDGTTGWSIGADETD